MKNYQISSIQPLPELKKYVRRVLITEGANCMDVLLPISPSGFSYLTYCNAAMEIHYHDRIEIENKPKLYFGGQVFKEQPVLKVKESDFILVGLELHPTILYYLFGISGEQLLDAVLNFDKAAYEVSRDFNEKIAKLDDGKIVGELLQQLLINNSEVHKRVPFLELSLELIYKAQGNISVSEITDKLKVSERHLRRTFKNIIGIAPKQYCKIIQFNTVFEAIQKDNMSELYDIALQHGYYDYAHFINNFKERLGKSPQEFLKSDYSFLKEFLGSSA